MKGIIDQVTGTYSRPEFDRSDWWHRLWRPFWVLPAAVAVGSAAVGAGLPHIDERLADHVPYLFESGPDGARQLLGTIASAMISVTGLVFSITMVVLQLASSQFTPRLLGEFLQSRVVQLTLGVFTGSFVYSLTVLRLVRGASGSVEEFVPQASVTLAFGYVITAVAFFIAFIHHITQSVRLSYVVPHIGHRTRAAAAALYGGQRPVATWSPTPGTVRRAVHHAGERGVVTAIDSTGLVGWAAGQDCVVALDLAIGDFVADGDEIGAVWGGGDALDPGALGRFVSVAQERTLWCDIAFGVRQLTDIADRALSPGVNDPTTAVQVIDELYAVLRPLASQPNLSPYLVDDDGTVRGLYRVQTFELLLETSLVEIAHYGEDSPRVLHRIRQVATQLMDVALPQHQPSVQRLLDRLAEDESPIATA